MNVLLELFKSNLSLNLSFPPLVPFKIMLKFYVTSSVKQTFVFVRHLVLAACDGVTSDYSRKNRF